MHDKPRSDEYRRLLHQFNQPLTAIGNYAQAGCQLIEQGRHDSARLQELFEKILQQSNRAGDCARELGKALVQGDQTSS